MGIDGADVAASIAKSTEADKSPGVTQRASELAQDQIAGFSSAALGQKRADAAEQAERNRIKRERERRRRELERKARKAEPGESDDTGEESGIDVVV